MNIYIYIYIHTHTHTHIYIDIYIDIYIYNRYTTQNRYTKGTQLITWGPCPAERRRGNRARTRFFWAAWNCAYTAGTCNTLATQYQHSSNTVATHEQLCVHCWYLGVCCVPIMYQLCVPIVCTYCVYLLCTSCAPILRTHLCVCCVSIVYQLCVLCTNCVPIGRTHLCLCCVSIVYQLWV